MHCPFCGHEETKVTDSRLAGGGAQIRRRRECLSCGERFTTFESAELVMPLVVSSTLLFFLGVGFCYFFVFGQVFKFIQGFAPKSITAAPDIEAYLGFVLTMFIAFGAAFEVPIVVIVLARMGLVSIQKLKDFRGYFVVLAFIIAAVITPPDVVSQLALAIPMCLLYEVGIWAAQIFIKHTQAPDAEGEKTA